MPFTPNGWGGRAGSVPSTKRGGWRCFDEARLFTRSLGLENAAQYARWCSGKLREKPSRPGDMPLHPDRVYADAFVSWPNWLGSVPVEWRPFEDARDFVRQPTRQGGS